MRSPNPESAIRAAKLVAKRVARESGGATQKEINEALYGDAQAPGYEEWQTQPGSTFADSENAVTGPQLDTSGTDPSAQLHMNSLRLWTPNGLNGQEIKRGGRATRAPGGSLSDAINSFSQERNARLTRPAAGSDAATQLALAELAAQHPQLAVAEPERENERAPSSVGQVADLGAEIDKGARWLSGEPDETDAPPKVSPTNKLLEDPTTTSISPQLAPGKPGQFRPQYALSRVDVDPRVINTIAGEASTRDPAATDAVINNMFNRLGSKGYGPSGNLFQVARAPGQYTGYRQASPAEAAFIQSRIQAIANGGVPDNTNGSMEYRGAWLYNKAAKMYPGGVGVGGNWFFKTPVQPGPYAARQADMEEAANDKPPSSPSQAPQSQSQAPRGHLKITDPNPDPLTSHAYPAPTETSGPPAAPPIQAQTTPSSGPPPAQLNDASAGPQAQADPMSDLYNKVAFGPDVQAGYDNPQVMFDPNAAPSAARGGMIHRAPGGSVYSMPTNELIARAMQIIRRQHRDAGGTTTTAAPAPTLDSLNKQYQQLAASQARDEASQNTMLNAQGLQASNALAAESANGNSRTPNQFDNNAIGAGQMIAAIEQARNPVNAAPQQQPAPQEPSTPAIPNGQVGNAAGTTGSPIGGVPNAVPQNVTSSSTDSNGPQYNNTLDQALGTNSPSMDQIFGFNYPVVPPPKPQPQGPVSQNEINALYGFGGGSQMGTGTDIGMFQSGGAIVMDALNKARRATKGKVRV